MSTNIKIQKICLFCGNEFTAQKTTTLYCSHKCNSRDYKAKVRNAKIEQTVKQTQQIKNKPIEDLKVKEFLTVKEVAKLLNCSIRTVYYYIDTEKIHAVNLSQRLTRVKRSEIDKLFEQPQQKNII